MPENCDDKQFDTRHVPQKMSVEEKKLRFRCLVQPELEAVYLELNDQYQRVQNTIKDNQNDEAINQLKVDYNANSNQQLLLALKPHPISIAIAQAAIETAWGTSRFLASGFVDALSTSTWPDPRRLEWSFQFRAVAPARHRLRKPIGIRIRIGPRPAG